MEVFIQATINGTTIYIKVDNSIIEGLFNVLHDNYYSVKSVSHDKWNINIEYGLSYEIDTIEELTTFKENNLKSKEISNELY